MEENNGNLREKGKKSEISAEKEVDEVLKDKEKKKGTEVCAFNQEGQEQETEKDKYIAFLEAEIERYRRLLKENNIDDSGKKEIEKKQGDGGNK